MSEAPKRIWAGTVDGIGHWWEQKDIVGHTEYVRADLSQALVAGAYEAASVELAKAAQAEAEINNPHDAELLWHMEKRIRALTGTEAQDALDAAIAKAVNAKLDAVAKAVAPMTIKIAVTPYQAGCGQIADTILAMKDPE